MFPPSPASRTRSMAQRRYRRTGREQGPRGIGLPRLVHRHPRTAGRRFSPTYGWPPAVPPTVSGPVGRRERSIFPGCRRGARGPRAAPRERSPGCPKGPAEMSSARHFAAKEPSAYGTAIKTVTPMTGKPAVGNNHAHASDARPHGLFHIFPRLKGLPFGIGPAPVTDCRPPSDPDGAPSPSHRDIGAARDIRRACSQPSVG